MPNAVRDSRVMVPQLPPRHISRSRLLAELDIAADLPLTLLSAGPGAGKTVLLTDWVRRSAARTAWLTPTPAEPPRIVDRARPLATSSRTEASRAKATSRPTNCALVYLPGIAAF